MTYGALRPVLTRRRWGSQRLEALRGVPALLTALPPLLRWFSGPLGAWIQDSYLVDSASSHMLVSKIKPCMSKYKQSIL